MNEQYKLSVASSPHASSPVGTRNLMLDVIIALLPALAISIFYFGPRALTMTLVSVAGCLFFEWAYEKLMKKPSTINDLSAVITGILLASPQGQGVRAFTKWCPLMTILRLAGVSDPEHAARGR